MEVKDEHLAKLLLAYEGKTLVCTDGEHYKFWNVSYNEKDDTITTKWGRIGNKVQSSTKESRQWSVKEEIEDMVNKKLKKGYEDITF